MEGQNAESVAGYCPHGEPYDDNDPCPDDPPQYAEYETPRIGGCYVCGETVPAAEVIVEERIDLPGFRYERRRHTGCTPTLIDGDGGGDVA